MPVIRLQPKCIQIYCWGTVVFYLEASKFRNILDYLRLRYPPLYNAVEITLVKPCTRRVGGKLSVSILREDKYFSWLLSVLVAGSGGRGKFKKHTAVSALFLCIIWFTARTNDESKWVIEFLDWLGEGSSDTTWSHLKLLISFHRFGVSSYRNHNTLCIDTKLLEQTVELLFLEVHILKTIDTNENTQLCRFPLAGHW